MMRDSLIENGRRKQEDFMVDAIEYQVLYSDQKY